MTEKLDPKKWYPFAEIFAHPEVRAAGDAIRSDATEPDWMDLFMGLCGLCQMAGPEETLNERLEAHEIGTPRQWEKFIRQGVIVFYSTYGGSDEVLEAWTLIVEIGGESVSFELMSDKRVYSFTEDDVEEISQVMLILDKSVWRPINA
jgi:hypothetical protein